MSHMGARVFTVLREDRPYELRDTEGKPISKAAARALILTKYHVPEDIRQERRKRKGRKANAPGPQKKVGMAAGRIHEAAVAPQPAASLPPQEPSLRRCCPEVKGLKGARGPGAIAQA